MTDVTATLAPATRPRLTGGDRCDRCGAQAYLRVVLGGGGQLLFCRHHFGRHESALRQTAVFIDDESEGLDLSTPER